MMGEKPLVAISRYSDTAASTRVRMDNWLRYAGLPAERHTYLGTKNLGPRTLALRAHAIPQAEFSLRRLADRIGDRRVLISRSASPFGNGGIEEKLLSRSDRGIYDFDDAIYASGSSRRSPFSSTASWERSVRAADVVIAGSDVLGERASAYSSDVRVIPSCIDSAQQTVKEDHSPGEIPRAVWLGSTSTERHLVAVAAPLLRAHDETGLRVSVISSGQASLGPLDVMVDRIEWELSTYQDELIKADFGIMPLPDNEFTRGKCSYKLLEYGASGLPVIGSGVGANVKALALLHGLQVDSSDQWCEALIDSARASTADRQSRGSLAREGVRAHYDYACWTDSWLAAMGAST